MDSVDRNILKCLRDNARLSATELGKKVVVGRNHSVSNNGAGEVFQKFPWMVGFSGSLPIEKNDRVCGAHGTIAVNPHIGFLATLYLCIFDAHYLSRRLVCMNYLVFIDKFV